MAARITRTLSRLICRRLMTIRSDALHKRQFTIRGLVSATVAFAAILALALAYPMLNGESAVVNLLMTAPAVIVLLLAVSFSTNRRRSIVTIGAFILAGWLMSPHVQVTWVQPAPSLWYRFRLEFSQSGIYLLAGAMTGVILDVLINCAIPKAKSGNA